MPDKLWVLQKLLSFLEYSPTSVPRVFTEWHKNIQCESVLRIETPCDKRGKGQYGSSWKNQISTLHKCDVQKSKAEHTACQTLRWPYQVLVWSVKNCSEHRFNQTGQTLRWTYQVVVWSVWSEQESESAVSTGSTKLDILMNLNVSSYIQMVRSEFGSTLMNSWNQLALGHEFSRVEVV